MEPLKAISFLLSTYLVEILTGKQESYIHENINNIKCDLNRNILSLKGQVKCISLRWMLLPNRNGMGLLTI